MATVSIAWDISIPDLGLTVGDLVRDPATRDLVRALSTDDLEQRTFWDGAGTCRSACRYVVGPGDAVNYLGFRLVRPAPAAPGT